MEAWNSEGISVSAGLVQIQTATRGTHCIGVDFRMTGYLTSPTRRGRGISAVPQHQTDTHHEQHATQGLQRMAHAPWAHGKAIWILYQRSQASRISRCNSLDPSTPRSEVIQPFTSSLSAHRPGFRVHKSVSQIFSNPAPSFPIIIDPACRIIVPGIRGMK